MASGKWVRNGMILALAALWIGWPASARADYEYTFSADTSAVAGQTGSLDFQFNGLGPGGTDTAMISTFTSIGGSIVSDPPTGAVTGDLLNLPVTITDSTPFNDVNAVFTFGTSLTFSLILTTNSASPGATFTFSMLDASGNPVNAIGGGNFSAVEVDVDQGGNAESPLTGAGVTGGQVSATPAPASAVLVAVGSFCLAGYRGWRRSRACSRTRQGSRPSQDFLRR